MESCNSSDLEDTFMALGCQFASGQHAFYKVNNFLSRAVHICCKKGRRQGTMRQIQTSDVKSHLDWVWSSKNSNRSDRHLPCHTSLPWECHGQVSAAPPKALAEKYKPWNTCAAQRTLWCQESSLAPKWDPLTYAWKRLLILLCRAVSSTFRLTS